MLVKFKSLKAKFKSVKLVHVKRAYNQVVDYITSKTLVLDASWEVEAADEKEHLRMVTAIQEKLMKPENDTQLQAVCDQDAVGQDAVAPGPESAPLTHAVKVVATVTQRAIRSGQGEPRGPLECQAERWRWIKVH